MTPFQLFSRTAPNKTFVAMLLGALGGISNALLIPVVVSSIGQGSSDARGGGAADTVFLGIEVSEYRFACAFLTLAVTTLVCRAISQTLLTRIAIDATSKLRQKIYQSVMDAPVAEVERVGFPRLVGAISNDVLRVVEGASVAPGVVIASITLAGMLGYLYLINAKVLLLVAASIVFGFVTFQVPIALGNRYLHKSRAGYDKLQEGVRGLALGGKDLKLSQAKQQFYMRFVLGAAEETVRLNGKRANSILAMAAAYGDMLSFLIIGVVTFVFTSYEAIDASGLLGCIMALLYLATPVTVLIGSITCLANAGVAMANIEAVVASLPPEPVAESPRPLSSWDEIGCVDLEYRYPPSAGSRDFMVGPVTLTVRRGEVVFIVGGNGSGKTSLARMLSLHYRPSAGHIQFGSQVIDKENLAAARECISAIYTDYHVFDGLLSESKRHSDSDVNARLASLGLAEKVVFTQGRFSTTALSDGQRKRLALLVAFLDDRDVYVFDEWAADQDPSFKTVFYGEIIPDLRSRGKIVLVISHDDRFFAVADRVIVMEDGKVASDTRVHHAATDDSGHPMATVAT